MIRDAHSRRRDYVFPAARHNTPGEEPTRLKTPLCAAVSIASLTLIPAGQARADSFDDFNYRFGGNTFTWELPSWPVVTPDNTYAGMMFMLPDVSVSENGGPAMPGTMDYWSSNCDGGMDFYAGDFDSIINMKYDGAPALCWVGRFADVIDGQDHLLL